MDLRPLRASADQAYAAVSAPDVAARTSLTEWVELLTQVQEAVNVLQAVHMVAMAHVSAIEDVALEDGTIVEEHRGLGHQRLDAPGLVAGRLGLSDQAAAQRMDCAISLVTRTPALVAAMASGALDAFRASVVCDELDDAPPAVAAEVVERMAEHLAYETAGPLRRRARRILGGVAPEVLARRAATVRERRGLHRSIEALGLDQWRGWYPVEQSRSAWAAVDAVAQEYLREGRAETIDQARADAHMDLLLAQVTATVHLHATVPAGSTEQASPPEGSPAPDGSAPGDHTDAALVEVGGLGAPGTSFVSRSWLSEIGTPASAPLHCHPSTGALLGGVVSDAHSPRQRTTGGPRPADAPVQSTGAPPLSRAYRPPPSMQALVRLRDGRCRFPGCTVSARFCDIDHVVPWPDGPTSPDNLICLCRRHHRVKQRLRWSVRVALDGTVTWCDPSGRVTTTLPVDHLHQVPDGQAVDVELPEQPGPRGLPLTTGPDTWSLLDDVLLRQLLEAGAGDPTRGRRAEPSSPRVDVWFPTGMVANLPSPPPRSDLPPF